MDVDIIAISSSDEEGDKETLPVNDVEPLAKQMKLDADADIEIIQLSDDDVKISEVTNTVELLPGTPKKVVSDLPVPKENSEDSLSTVNSVPQLKEVALEEIPVFFQQFVEDCIGSLKNEKLVAKAKSKTVLLYKAFKRAGDYNTSDEFKKIIGEYTLNIKVEPQNGIRYFYDAFKLLRLQNSNKLENGSDVQKLQKCLNKISEKIRNLEESCDDDDVDDDTSNYIKLQKYKERATLIYAKIMELEKNDPLSCRLYYARLDYVSSKHAEINRAINKKFKCRKKIVFPTFDEVNKCVRSCIEENANLKLKLTESAICREVQFNFEHLGNLIQRKRKQDLAHIHYESFLGDSVDPAQNDPALEEKLRNNKKLGDNRLNKTFEKYADTEWDTHKELSEDSDDSHNESLDSDHNENAKDEEK